MVDFSVYTILGSLFSLFFGAGLVFSSRDPAVGIFIGVLGMASVGIVSPPVTVILLVAGIVQISRVLIQNSVPVTVEN